MSHWIIYSTALIHIRLLFFNGVSFSESCGFSFHMKAFLDVPLRNRRSCFLTKELLHFSVVFLHRNPGVHYLSSMYLFNKSDAITSEG